ncbi:MAG TPA: tRNA uridine-5-carboxymethylaminomethyl(34) synthesis GTPase MnmE [Thermotogaceae bacterium]|nr:tRNA uridine-5-carboxymethylaminomethyl(34) synthesis GTPase MnmE [Thermotogaceae bacterium]
MFDTIAAISTPRGIGAISIIRLSGPKTLDIIKNVFTFLSNVKEIKPRYAYYGKIIDPISSEIVDTGICVYYKLPNSYTGEDMAEISCHGGILVSSKVLEVILKAGARLAEPGEFTKRAFLNGKMDLIQAEAVNDLINCKTDLMLKISNNQLLGKGSEKIKNLRDKLLSISAEIEVHIDYPEEDLSIENPRDIYEKLENVYQQMREFLISADNGMVLKEGINTVIVGKPNVGKSTLLNRLLREDRAIVTNIPGTTRDVIIESLNIRGVLLRVVDTAGIRESSDVIEKIGIKKTIEEIKKADLILFVLDASEPLSEDDLRIMELIKKKDYLVILNKRDLNYKISIENIRKLLNGKNHIVEISALKGEGLEKLEDAIYSKVEEMIDLDVQPVVTNLRQKIALQKSSSALKEALNNFNSYPIDVISIDIRKSIEYLDELLGFKYSDDLLENIFSNFCVGK